MNEQCKILPWVPLNRFGEKAETAVPEDVPLVKSPGHRLRSAGKVVDRNALLQLPSPAAAGTMPMEAVADGQEEPDALGEQTVVSRPNRFTGPTFLNPKERYRLDGHKMMYHLDRVQAWLKGERFAPIHIDMGLTKFCNTACIYCFAVLQNMTKGSMIQRDALLRFIEDCGRLQVRSIGFIGDGEPTLNPALYDATVLASRCGVDTAMATNGLLLEMERAHDLLANMSFIRFNLSAGTGAGFQRVHQSSARNFDLLVDKIRAMVQLKKSHGHPCTLGLQMVLVPECFDQVLAEARLGAELGVDYFVIKQCTDSEYRELGIPYEDYQKMGEILRQAESFSTPDYHVQVKWSKINASGETDLYKGCIRKYDICYGTPFLSQISGNGRIYPCGPFFNKERFYLGDLHEESYYDLVMSDRYWAVHQDIVASVDVHADCAIGCRADYLNKYLWDLKNPPEHINFI